MMTPGEMAKQVGAGLLSFPVTHFSDQLDFQTKPYQEHIAWLLSHKPAGLFVAGGTGEFFSLTPTEFSAVVRAGVAQTAQQVPVIAGCGYGTAIARELAQAAEQAGADGILLLPPYLVSCGAVGISCARGGGLRVDQTRRDHVQPRQRCSRRRNARGPV